MTNVDQEPVIAAVIRRGRKVLLCRRPKAKRHGGLWEFPGGKLLAGESFEQGARRELEEELGLTATSVGNPLLTVVDPGSAFAISFCEVEVAGDPQLLEHEELAWVEPCRFCEFPLAPSDLEFSRWLQEVGPDGGIA